MTKLDGPAVRALAQQIREMGSALKEEKERHQMEELSFNEASKKATNDI